MDFAHAVARIYDHIEQDRVESAVMACVRIARATKDYVNAATFLRELYPNKGEVLQALYADISPLNKDAQKFVFETSLERWLSLHTVEGFAPPEDEDKDDGEKRNVLAISAGEIEGELQQAEHAIADMTLPAGMGEFDTAAFTDRFLHQKTMMRLRIKAIHILKSRIKTRCLNYAIQIERQLDLQKKSENFLETVQSEVNTSSKTKNYR